MDLMLSALSGYSIFQIVLFCLIMVALISFITVFVLWRKGKSFPRMERLLFRAEAVRSLLAPRFKSRFVNNPNKKEQIFYIAVLLFGFLSAVLGLVVEIMGQAFSLSFLFNIFFLFTLAILMVCDEQLAARDPYYYSYNPSLVLICIIYLLYAFVGFVKCLAGGELASSLIGVFSFLSSLFLYGGVLFMRFSKKEFKLGNMLIYIGGAVAVVLDILNFFLLCLGLPPVEISLSVFSTLFSIGTVVIILYVYDRFYFLKNLFRRNRV